MKPYYQDPAVTIFHGDCRELLLQCDFSVLVTDPPYGVNLGNHDGVKEKRPGFLVKAREHQYDDSPEAFSKVVPQTVNVALKLCGRGAVFAAVPSMFQLPPADQLGGIYLPAGCGRGKWGFQNLAIVLFYGTCPGLENGAKPTTVKIHGQADDVEHPCPKPLLWLNWLVSMASTESDTVIDPFMGSGTTLRAAKDLGRHAIGIEINEAYCEIAAKRMQQEVLPLSTTPIQSCKPCELALL